jgi:hypothetical protein
MAAAVRPVETRELEQRHYQLGRASNAAYLLGEVQGRLQDAVRAARSAGASYPELRRATGYGERKLRRMIELRR